MKSFIPYWVSAEFWTDLSEDREPKMVKRWAECDIRVAVVDDLFQPDRRIRWTKDVLPERRIAKDVPLLNRSVKGGWFVAANVHFQPMRVGTIGAFVIYEQGAGVVLAVVLPDFGRVVIDMIEGKFPTLNIVWDKFIFALE